MRTTFVLLKGVPYSNLVQWPAAVKLEKHFNVVLTAMLYLFPWFPKGSWGFLQRSHSCGSTRTGAAKGDGTGFGTAGYNISGEKSLAREEC